MLTALSGYLVASGKMDSDTAGGIMGHMDAIAAGVIYILAAGASWLAKHRAAKAGKNPSA